MDEIKLLKKSGLQLDVKVKYLGITVTKRVSTLMENNYLTLLKEIQQSFKKWDKL